MQHKPHVIFTDDLKDIIRSIEIVDEFVPFLKRNGYEYRYPFIEGSDSMGAESQIERDADKFKLHVASEKLGNMWDSLSGDMPEAADSPSIGTFICVLTMYGPRGFFYTPNTIYVNIAFDSEREWVQTMLHEILHLVHFEETKEMSHKERESFIDKKFIELWGEDFPEYNMQNLPR